MKNSLLVLAALAAFVPFNAQAEELRLADRTSFRVVVPVSVRYEPISNVSGSSGGTTEAFLQSITVDLPNTARVTTAFARLSSTAINPGFPSELALECRVLNAAVTRCHADFDPRNDVSKRLFFLSNGPVSGLMRREWFLQVSFNNSGLLQDPVRRESRFLLTF